MLMTESQLRNKIRRILNEWHEHYERQWKLMDLIKSGITDNINQALELSEAMGYIGSFEYSQEIHDGYSGKRAFHTYKLYGPFEEEFLPALRKTQKYGGKYFELDEPEDGVVVLMFSEKIR